MKTRIISIGMVLLGILSSISCKKAEPSVYSGQLYVQFYSATDILAVTTAYSSFYYLDPSKTTDTVLLRMSTLGSTPSKTSYFKFQAFKDPSATPKYPDAVAGTQYVSFDDANLQKLWKFEAGKYEAYVPIILKRDPSLKTAVYQLRFRIVDSDDLKVGSPNHREGIIYISDKLSQPSLWPSYFFLGAYGPVKHQFVIEHSGERWDDTFITSITSDSNLQSYYLYKFNQELKALNAARIAAGLTELREDPALASTAVTFPSL